MEQEQFEQAAEDYQKSLALLAVSRQHHATQGWECFLFRPDTIACVVTDSARGCCPGGTSGLRGAAGACGVGRVVSARLGASDASKPLGNRRAWR